MPGSNVRTVKLELQGKDHQVNLAYISLGGALGLLEQLMLEPLNEMHTFTISMTPLASIELPEDLSPVNPNQQRKPQ